ncbi:MAG TPA: LCP family protein [Candidatus Fusicatenibacter merdavium]|uniref:LCP family protein n=1 Tax=Candidatus Fusicatenibacter merdavium TaxID=2838600 RepID=A0A9D1XE85_9FIRM|nr:LCP family protein [Candidatus Fusicatenibacter merdavium]
MKKQYEDWESGEELQKKSPKKSSGNRSSGKKKKNKRRKLVNILTIIMIIIVLILLGIYAVINHYYGKSNYVDDSEIGINSSVETESTGITDEEAEQLQTEIIEQTDDITLPNDENVYNLLLIGVDRRDKTWYGNSDSMILMSINKDTKKVHMTSFMRDLYANIPGVGVKKLNAACAYGGGPLVVKTIQDNYKIPIDNYASVDFDAMIDIVDLVGGVEIDISSEEMRVANGYINEMCGLAGVDASSHQLTQSGPQLMDGYQAVAYARIRYVGNADYQRTERQREVLEKIMKKCSGLGVTELNDLANAVLPEVTHNIDQSTLLSLIGQLPTILSYEVVQSRVPYDGMFSSKGEMLVPDFTATIQKLQTDIYGDTTVGQ